MNKKKSVSQVSGVKPVLVFKFPITISDVADELKKSIEKDTKYQYHILVIYGSEFDIFDCKMLNGELSATELETFKKIYKDVTTFEPDESACEQNLRKLFASDNLDKQPVTIGDRIRSWFGY